MSITLGEILAKASQRPEDIGLTPRELEILSLVSQGYVSKVIAAKFGTQQRTVDHQRAHIMEKLGAKTPAHMVYIACRRGLL